MLESEAFAQQLRMFKRHQLYFWLGTVLTVIGFATSFWTKQTLASLGAPFSMVSAYYAWVGGKAMNISYGATFRDGMDTRTYEELSPTKRRGHARRVAIGLALFALGTVSFDAFAFYGSQDPAGASRMLDSALGE